MTRQLASAVLYVALFAAFLFLPAGTMHWRAGWILLGVLVVVRALSAVRLSQLQPELAVERTTLPLQAGRSPVDLPLVLAFMASFAALIAFASADRWRLHLFPMIAPAARVTGLLLFALGGWIVYLALSTNAYAVLVVRFQAERGHRVVDAGPYRHVRHPMYSGVVVNMVGLCLWLGSTAALLAAVVPLGILAVRIVFEERLLRGQLAGYGDYAKLVRWRLVPGVW